MNKTSSAPLVPPSLLFGVISQQHDLLQALKQRGLYNMCYRRAMCQNKADEAPSGLICCYVLVYKQMLDKGAYPVQNL